MKSRSRAKKVSIAVAFISSCALRSRATSCNTREESKKFSPSSTSRINSAGTSFVLPLFSRNFCEAVRLRWPLRRSVILKRRKSGKTKVGHVRVAGGDNSIVRDGCAVHVNLKTLVEQATSSKPHQTQEKAQKAWKRAKKRGKKALHRKGRNSNTRKPLDYSKGTDKFQPFIV